MPSDPSSLSHISSAEQNLKVEQSKFEAIFYGSESQMVIFQGPDMVYEMFNSKYQDIYPGRELLGKKLLDAVPELANSPFPIILKNVYESGRSYVSHEGLARIMNNETGVLEERYFDTTFSRINYGEGQPYRILATPREVTDRVMSRRVLEKNLDELEQERELRERFVSALSHDLRTPLAIVKMGAQILKLKSDDVEEVATMSDRISLSVDRADRMIRNLLDANRIKAGEGIPISIQECRLDLILEYVVNELKEIYGNRFFLQGKMPEVHGFWDEMAIHRVVENLCINAIKYGADDTNVTLELNLLENAAEISIHNTGNPISNEDQKSLFTPGKRTKTALLSGQIGWGIGLALVKAITEAHGGSLRVTSDSTSGTNFYVKIPLDSRK